MIHYIYKIINTITDKIYVGVTINPTLRLTQHKNRALSCKYNSALYNAINLYGVDNFSMEILFCTKDEDYSYEMEIKFIHTLNTLTPNGYNIDSGGKGGNKQKAGYSTYISDTNEKIICTSDEAKINKLTGIASENRMFMLDNKEYYVNKKSLVYKMYLELLSAIDVEKLHGRKSTRCETGVYLCEDGINRRLSNTHPDVICGKVCGTTKGKIKVRYFDSGVICLIDKNHKDLIDNVCVFWASNVKYCTNGERIFAGPVDAGRYIKRDPSVVSRLCNKELNGWKFIYPFNN